mmetsp:Transcript_24369/g.71722  ORF Transcript_24369/g.71722 Transcript_24369/m.71722 type:complete len:207 (-) Transcript_24369:277-897(-)
MPPRATLIKWLPQAAPSGPTAGMRSSISPPTSSRVCGVSAQCSETCEHVQNSSSADGSSVTPSSDAVSDAACGEYANTRMPRAAAAAATPRAILPNPRRPRFLPASSEPSREPRAGGLSHSPLRRPRSAAGRLRAAANRRARVISTTDAVDAEGVLTTVTPEAWAPATSMLSTPTPARPTTRSRPAAPAESASARRVVADLMMTAS